MAKTTTPISGGILSDPTVRKLARLVKSNNIQAGSKRRVGNAHGLAILEEMEKNKNRLIELEARLKKLEKTVNEHEKTVDEHEKAIKKLDKTVEEHEKKWNRVRTYELLDNGSRFEDYKDFKPKGIISLERHEIVHGGDVLRDVQTLMSAKNKVEKESFLAASKGFECLYGLSAEKYGSEIMNLREQVIDVLNIKSNVENLRFWRSHKDKENLLEMADSIIKKWKSGVEDGPVYSECDLKADYEMLRTCYQNARH